MDELTGEGLIGPTRSDIVVNALSKVTASAVVIFLLVLSARSGLLNLDDKPHLAALIIFAFFLHLWTRPGVGEIAAVILLASAVRVLYGQPHSVSGSFFVLFTYGAFLGLASIVVLGVQTLRSSGAEQERRRVALTAGLLSPVAFMLLGFPLRLTIWLHPKTYDHFLYAFDASLGFQPSFWIGRAFAQFAPLRLACGIAYDVILLVIACFYIGQIVGCRRFQVDVVKVFLGTLFFGTLLYHMCPAAGPVYAFGRAFPQHEPPMSQVSMQLVELNQGPRNAMPSLHLACALLVWWNTRPWGHWARLLAGTFLVLTTLATLGLGEHYLIDLIVAVPFTVAMSATCTRCVPMQSAARRLALAGGGAMTLLWLLLLRSVTTWPAHVFISWLLVLGTLAASVILQRRLARTASESAKG